MDLKEIRWKDVGRIHQYCDEPSGTLRDGEFLE
jgi:hypothetical protein